MRTKRSVRCAHLLTLSKMQHCVVQIVGFMAWLGLCQTSGNCRLCLCLLNCVRTPAKQNCRRSRSSRLARVGRCSWSGYMYSLRPRGLPRPYWEKRLGTLVGRLFSSTACMQAMAAWRVARELRCRQTSTDCADDACLHVVRVSHLLKTHAGRWGHTKKN